MDALWNLVGSMLARFEWRTVVDVAFVAGVLYWLLTLISGTSAATLVRGMLILLTLGFVLSNVLNLTMLQWLLRNSLPAMLVAIPVLFAPELRRALEQLGRAGALLPRAPSVAASSSRVADAVSSAAQRLAERRWGALVVIERGTQLGEYAESGIPIDGVVSVDLLLSIFYPNSPLHDGAVIIRGDRIVAAGVVLPLPANSTVEHMGTRHRAALGITERSDAIAVIVSEETGAISIANAGRMVRNLGQGRLGKVLAILDRSGSGAGRPPWRPWVGSSRTRDEPEPA